MERTIKNKFPSGKLTSRERFRRVMHYQNVDRIPNFEFGYWNETLPTWHSQGLPLEIDNEEKAYKFFGIDSYKYVPIQNGLLPQFEQKVLEETQEYMIIIDAEGIKCQIFKNGASTIPHYLEYSIKNKDDWERFKERLNPADPARYPENWDEIVLELQKRDYPVCIHCGSLLGKLRDWMGFENIALAFYDMPDLVDEMIEYMTDFSIKLMEKALKDVEVDFALGWEDIAFNKGPIISPQMFKEFLTLLLQEVSIFYKMEMNCG
jgi:uroporphyrinogen decarboxylase